MHFYRDYFSGCLLPWRGARLLLAAPRTWRWALAPLVANIILYAALFAAALWLLSRYEWWHFDWQFWGGCGAWLAENLNAAGKFLRYLVGVPVLAAGGYFTFAAVGQIVAAPFIDGLSEKCEAHLTGRASVADGVPFARSVWLSVASATRMLARQIFWLLLTLPLLLVPVVGHAAWFLLNSYFTGLGWLDAPLSRHNWTYAEKIAAGRARKMALTGFGSMALIIFAVPLTAFLLLPLGVAGATILYVEIGEREGKGIREEGKVES
ncbi:MAG: EI24 domain-containing protein [Planctomycetota bacterium]|nr:EI24 domain-containing protein [Planctomycetota bacterium]